LTRFHHAGIRAIRLDAVGYAVKKAGTSCFMIPDTFEFIDALTAKAHALGIRPPNAVTVLDTHDGIGVLDVGADRQGPGLLAPEDIDTLVEAIHERSN